MHPASRITHPCPPPQLSTRRCTSPAGLFIQLPPVHWLSLPPPCTAHCLHSCLLPALRTAFIPASPCSAHCLHSNCCRDIQFQADTKPYKQRPYAERETPKGAFGNLYPQAVPSAPDSQAVKGLG